MSTYFRQRQEGQSSSSIEGKKINNYLTCSVKEVRTLSPQVIQMVVREQTFQSDSFKQILSRRSAGNINKENMSVNPKKLRKIQEEPTHSKSGHKIKSKCKKSSDAKQSTSSLHKFTKKNDKNLNKKSKQRKSMSPLRDNKNYRSGPSDKRGPMISLNQYISVNNQSKTSRQGIGASKSDRNLTERIKNPLKSLQNYPKNKQLKQKENSPSGKKKVKKRKNVSKANLLINTTGRPASTLTRTQSIAKQFDALIKCPVTKRQKQKDKDKSQSTTIKKQSSKGKMKKNKDKKVVIISNNNSKTLIQRIKPPQDFSEDSRQSPGKILTMKYEQQKNISKKKRDRLSFQPSKKRQKKGNKIKTEIVQPQKNLVSKNEAAIMIQKNFRGYITRKYIKQFKQGMSAVIDIQRVWRGYLGRKRFRQMKAKKNKSIELRIKKMNSLQQILNDVEENKSIQLNSLLEDILKQENVNSRIKEKIEEFLKKQGKYSSRSSIMSHNQLQMKSEKRFFEEMERKKYNLNSPFIKCSPKLEKSELLKSPQVMLESLLTIQEFHREKLISNANMQREGLESLAMKNLFSPRTHQNKRKQIDERLENDLKKFQSSMGEVIKSCKQNEDLIGPIKPFSGLMTPERKSEGSKQSRRSQSPQIDQMYPINSSERKIQDLSMQLLEYYEQKTQHKQQNTYEQFDSSYQFIQEYLLTLFEYLRQKGEGYCQQFVDIMKESKNLQVGVILKNLNTVTEDEDDDICFKLPMYKYLGQEQKEIISLEVSQQFNNNFNKLQRHQLSYHHKNLEDQYLKMLIDCINEALNQQRTCTYLFTEMALCSSKDGIRIKEIKALEAEDCTKEQAQFSFFFAKAMNQIYNWAHQQCGTIVKEEIEAEKVFQLNEKRLKDYLKAETQQHWDCYDELLQVIVGVADQIFDQIVMEEGVSLYL